MTIKRLLLGVALGAALAVGLWATRPAAPAAEAGVLEGPPGQTFDCSRAFPTGELAIRTVFRRTPAQAVALLGEGYVCIPVATDEAAPRFDCQFRGATFTNRRLSAATAVLRAGGSCLPAGLPVP